MVRRRAKSIAWTKELCTEKAKAYSSRRSWSDNDQPSYRAALENEWLDECCPHMTVRFVHNAQSCMESAKRYLTRNEWAIQDYSAYKAAKRLECFEFCCSHMAQATRGAPRKVYWFVDHTSKFAYVGLTLDPRRRSLEHLRKKRELKVSLSDGSLVYECTEVFYSESEAQKLEAELMEHWKSLGYTLLNKAKAGSLGGCQVIWTKETCRDQALKFETRTQWMNNGRGYQTASKRGWLDYCCSHMKGGPRKKRSDSKRSTVAIEEMGSY